MSIAEDFQAFWLEWPHKVGKFAAEKAYRKALKKATAEEIREGIKAYLAAKPSWAAYCNPSTYLNQGRWLDQGTTTTVTAWSFEDCPHTPRCGTAGRESGRWRCHQRTELERAKREQRA